MENTTVKQMFTGGAAAGSGRKNVLLLSVDSKMPVPALMKLSTYHKKLGDRVFFGKPCNPDVVYATVIFQKHKADALGLSKMFTCPVHLGGPAISTEHLPDEIEHLMPDYGLYGLDYAVGFSSRGCSRHCAFCSVCKLEGDIREHAPFSEFVLPRHEKVLLLDNNFLMSPKCEEKLDYLLQRRLAVSICQGLDARLITKDLADKIARLRLYNWKFTDKALYTAWDRIEDEAEVLEGIDNLIEAGVKPRFIRPYVLVGFNSTLEQDVYRWKKLWKRGVYPFIMPYNRKYHPLRRYGQRPAYFKTTDIDVYLKQIGIKLKAEVFA